MGRRSAAPASQADSGYFKGDDDLMVDRLVAACSAQKKALPELLPGFGRDLTPYFNPGTEGSEEDINTDFASETTASSSPPSPQSLSFVPMTKTTPCQVMPSTPHTKRGRKSRKKLEYGTKSSDSDSGSESAGSRHAHSKPKKTALEPCFSKGQAAQPPSNFLTLAASTVSEEQRQRVAQAFAQAANAANAGSKHAKAAVKQNRSSSDFMTLAANSVSEEQRQQVAQAFALSNAASKRGSQRQAQEKRPLPRNPSDSTRPTTLSGSSPPKWAGGAFANVPDPTNVPMPSMLLNAASSALQSGTTQLPSSPAQQPFTSDPSLMHDSVSPADMADATSNQLLAMLNGSGTTPYAIMPSHCGQTTSTAKSIVDAAASQALRQLLNF
mmetsp:Transcript_34626/g.75675  ORF Transcript_34626/g.75675 Transcript_34626/m.75675 type:complete len:383 (-) Transcript_34626:1054-2202(-)|eukprot:CAMPEP_0118932648 /NCGR_PEP_ID=MMETSP1169-20130426/10546_1 /TAXON_ID=36882 /ORGANISM="Pyramimonas obovata, Strain CCMP722" /LENGTH=382 /DNA_ID=CAMNT_0006875339 /DNA_START=311 /DNA_END=1459 /DNA_ORIENTATION=-